MHLLFLILFISISLHAAEVERSDISLFGLLILLILQSLQILWRNYNILAFMIKTGK